MSQHALGACKPTARLTPKPRIPCRVRLGELCFGQHPNLSRIAYSVQRRCPAARQLKTVRQALPPKDSTADDVLTLQGGQLATGKGNVVLSSLNADLCVREVHGLSTAVVLDVKRCEHLAQIDLPVGKLECTRHLSAARCKLWWMTPEFGRSAMDISPETQFLLIELQDGGPYAIIIPLISKGKFRGTLRPPPPNHSEQAMLWLRMESNSEKVKASHISNAVLVQASWDLYGLVDKAVAAAAYLSGGSKPLSQKQLPKSVDVFGWCTWDAFYSRVSAKGVREGLKSLNQGGIPAKLLVIDDGWQQTDIDEEQRRIFGDEGVLMEEVVEAERKALQKEATDLATKDAGSAAASATMSLTFLEDEQDVQERKNIITQTIEEGLIPQYSRLRHLVFCMSDIFLPQEAAKLNRDAKYRHWVALCVLVVVPKGAQNIGSTGFHHRELHARFFARARGLLGDIQNMHSQPLFAESI